MSILHAHQPLFRETQCGNHGIFCKISVKVLFTNELTLNWFDEEKCMAVHVQWFSRFSTRETYNFSYLFRFRHLIFRIANLQLITIFSLLFLNHFHKLSLFWYEIHFYDFNRFTVIIFKFHLSPQSTFWNQISDFCQIILHRK